MREETEKIFRQNSTSYYYSSLFFPNDVKKDVFKLYAYVRTADDYVDDHPQQPEKLEAMRATTMENWESGKSGDLIVDEFLDVARKRNFKKEWVEAFLDSMEMDLYKSSYETMDETLEYIYGSAEVIGLMMARILELDEQSYEAAKMLGRSMQYCNFIRDIEEDNGLGRQYLPQKELEKHGLDSLDSDEIDREKFEVFLRSQIQKYRKWQSLGEEGLRYIPFRVRVPVILSSRMYKWTASRIEKDPLVVYSEKIRPSKPRIFIELVRSFFGRK